MVFVVGMCTLNLFFHVRSGYTMKTCGGDSLDYGGFCGGAGEGFASVEPLFSDFLQDLSCRSSFKRSDLREYRAEF